MSVKPTPAQLPTWDTSLLNTIALTGIHKTNGFVNSEIPTTGEANTLFGFLYLWCQYLSDGNFQGAVTMDTSLAMATGTSVTVSGVGKYKRGTRVRHLSGSAAVISAPAPSSQTVSRTSGSVVLFRAVSDKAVFSFSLEEGEQLQSVSVYVANGVTDVQSLLVYKDTWTIGSILNTTQLGVTANSVGHSNLTEVLSVTGLTENVGSASVQYSAQVICTGFANLPYLYGLEYVTTIP